MENRFLQFVNEASGAHKAAYEAFEQLAEANAQTWEKLISAQLDMASVMVEAGSKQLRLLSEARDHRQVLAAQARFVEEYGNKFVQKARQMATIMAGARDAYNEWIENGVDSATENLRRTATKRAA
jgi:hypothetical protein